MHLSKMLSVVTLYVFFLVVTLVGSPATAGDARSDVPAGSVFQDRQAALAADIALLADQTGLPVSNIEASMTFQERSASYLDDLVARYPEQIAAVWIDPVP